MSMIDELMGEPCEVCRNRTLFGWLRDDAMRKAFFADLKDQGFPVLRVKSLARDPDRPQEWPGKYVYFVSKESQVREALQQYSVRPYASLDSHGKFMLGLEAGTEHDAQNKLAKEALQFDEKEIRATAKEAVRRALVLPTKNRRFDLVTDVARQAALRFVALLFGLPPQAHVELELAMDASYTRLVFEIIGRHFVAEPGVPPDDPELADKIRQHLNEYVRNARDYKNTEALCDEGLPKETCIYKLFELCNPHRDKSKDEPLIVALGLMAGTIGNIGSAVAIVIWHLFERARRIPKEPLLLTIDEAIEAARSDDPGNGRDRLWEIIDGILQLDPPAPFLARAACGKTIAYSYGDTECPIPDGADVIIALVPPLANDLVFGGRWDDAAFPHRCVGQKVAKPLIREIVRRVLLLPGLSRVIDSASGQPMPLVRQWGAMCTSFPLQFDRERLIKQNVLRVELPIATPVAENAEKLIRLTRAGAYIVEDALRRSKHVHFAWFSLVQNNTHLALTTVYDGDFDNYVEFFALAVPLFDEQFKFLADPPPTPIQKHPKEFVETIRKYNCPPLVDYFFTAYMRPAVADIANAGIDPIDEYNVVLK